MSCFKMIRDQGLQKLLTREEIRRRNAAGLRAILYTKVILARNNGRRRDRMSHASVIMSRAANGPLNYE